LPDFGVPLKQYFQVIDSKSGTFVKIQIKKMATRINHLFLKAELCYGKILGSLRIGISIDIQIALSYLILEGLHNWVFPTSVAPR